MKALRDNPSHGIRTAAWFYVAPRIAILLAVLGVGVLAALMIVLALLRNALVVS